MGPGHSTRGHVEVLRNLHRRTRDRDRHTDTKALVITALPLAIRIIRFFEPEIPRKRRR
jgi:hypothetical protein